MIELSIWIPLSIGAWERGERFEFPICDLFDECDGGDIVGSGSFGDGNGVAGCDIQIELASEALLPKIRQILTDGGAPPETTIRVTTESDCKTTTLSDSD